MFLCEMVHYGESLLPSSQEFFASDSKAFILVWEWGGEGAGGWALGFHSMGFRHFPDVFSFLKILRLKLVSNS